MGVFLKEMVSQQERYTLKLINSLVELIPLNDPGKVIRLKLYGCVKKNHLKEILSDILSNSKIPSNNIEKISLIQLMAIQKESLVPLEFPNLLGSDTIAQPILS